MQNSRSSPGLEAVRLFSDNDGSHSARTRPYLLRRSSRNPHTPRNLWFMPLDTHLYICISKDRCSRATRTRPYKFKNTPREHGEIKRANITPTYILPPNTARGFKMVCSKKNSAPGLKKTLKRTKCDAKTHTYWILLCLCWLERDGVTDGGEGLIIGDKCCRRDIVSKLLLWRCRLVNWSVLWLKFEIEYFVNT